MLSLGHYQHLPEFLAKNPFHSLVVRFSRFKNFSWEFLFHVEAVLMRYSGISLLVMFALVLPRFEEINTIGPTIRHLMLVYPIFFIWSLTRISGVELMQVILEGRWTAEIVSTPITNLELKEGFVSPVWLVMRQYMLISIFSLALYTLETNSHLLIPDDDQLKYMVIAMGIFNEAIFFNAIAWILFIYMARLYTEVRFRNGLIKGLITLALMLGGILLVAGYGLLFYRYGHRLTDWRVLGIMCGLTGVLTAGAFYFHVKLARHFRGYLLTQLDIDLLVFDRRDPRTSAWEIMNPELDEDMIEAGLFSQQAGGGAVSPRI